MNLTTNALCPMCSAEMQFSWETVDIPHFGESMVIAGVCECGYRHSDTILLTQKELRKTLAKRLWLASKSNIVFLTETTRMKAEGLTVLVRTSPGTVNVNMRTITAVR